MMTKPTWLYKPITIPTLPQIQKEVLNLINNYYSDVFSENAFGKESSQYLGIEIDQLRDHAPTYMQFLKDLKLYDRLSAFTLVGTLNGLTAKPAVVHVDDRDWTFQCFALNLPLQNCKNSYTVWYETVVDEGISIPNSENPSDPYYFFRNVNGWHDNQLVKEIGRWEVSNPAFVNIGMPHRPESHHNDLRLLLSTRFSPEIFEFLL
jgi:hypothetical protein